MKLSVAITCLVWSAFWVGCGGDKTSPSSSLTDVDDILTMTVNQDGTYRVVCKDGSVEGSVTAQDISDDNVCMSPVAFQAMCGSDDISEETRKTIFYMMMNVGETSCEPAGKKIRKAEALFLESLDLVDLSPLAGLTSLRTLYLAQNQLVDLSPLAGLTMLKNLYLSENQLVDLSPLQGLEQLSRLDLSRNQIVDLSPLGRLPLERLELAGNPIGIDVERNATNCPVDAVNAELRTFCSEPSPALAPFLADCQSSNTTSVTRYILEKTGTRDCRVAAQLMSTVTDLDNRISVWNSFGESRTLDILIGLTKLEHLELYGPEEAFADVSFLSYFPHLKRLEISFASRATGIGALPNLQHLEALTIRESSVTDLSFLGSLPSLQLLSIKSSDLESVAGLGRFPTLRTASFRSNHLRIWPDVDLPNLSELDIDHNQIDDIEGLASLRSLVRLWADSNAILSIDSIAQLTKLTALHLTGNKIWNLHPLRHLEHLSEFRIGDNPIAKSHFPRSSLNCPADAKSSSIRRFCGS